MMQTRCPACGTAFRVTPEQLKVRAGKVRCGRCSGVFNALESLEEGAPVATPPSPLPPLSPSPQPPGEEAAPVDIQPEIAEPAPVSDAETQQSNDAFVAAMWSEKAAASINAPRPSRRLRVAWSFGALLLAVLLAAHFVYTFRAEVAQMRPDWRPTMESWCAALGCDLPLPQRPELVGIETSDLHPDPNTKNLLVLSATLKNRAAFTQAYPHLELTLTDTRDQPVARRVFSPADYVAGTDKPGSGLAQNADLAVNLWLDATSVPATGYRLYLFYP